MNLLRILLAGSAVLTLLVSGCENTGDEAAISAPAIDDAYVELAAVDVVEGDDSVTLHAYGPSGAEIGSLTFERVSSTDGLYPIAAAGYFDVSGLDEAAIDQRAEALEIALDYPALEGLAGCALKMAQAIAVCMDGDEFVLTCPLGLQAVLCECGPAFKIPAARLAKICGQ